MRIVLEHTKGHMKGVHSICGLTEEVEGLLPEIVDTTVLLDSPRMRTPGPASLVACKRSYVLYREIYMPEKMEGRAQPNAPFDARQV